MTVLLTIFLGEVLEKLIVVHLLKTLSSINELLSSLLCSQESVLSEMNTIHVPVLRPYFFEVPFNILQKSRSCIPSVIFEGWGRYPV
jgi:hypothetical protein